MVVATSQFSLKALNRPQEFWTRVEALLTAAKREWATAVCFPEFFSLSWGMSLSTTGGFHERLRDMSSHLDEFLKSFQDLSDQFSQAIVAGTIPLVIEGELRNRCYIFRPRQPPLSHDKFRLVEVEKKGWQLCQGPERLQGFEWQGQRCAVAICYEVEFPQVSLALARAGVDVLFVPSCTSTEHGYWRVRHSASARSIENQMFTVVSSLVEGDPRFAEIERHHGQGVILSPCDGRFPTHGLVALGDLNREGVTSAKLDLDELQRLHRSGAVLNRHDVVEAQIPAFDGFSTN